MSPDSPVAVAPVAGALREAVIAGLALLGIVAHLVLRFGLESSTTAQAVPLLAVLVLGGVPLVWDLSRKLLRREFGSDLLAGLSIVTSIVLGEYLAGAFVVLMLAGGATLEAYAVRSASSVLRALADRMPSIAHRQVGSRVEEVALSEVAVGDVVLVMPHETCPIDGTVLAGHSVMDESYLTGEPYLLSKTPGSAVISGAINGESVLTIRADRLAVDSRYAKIMRVMQSSEQHRPRLRRIGDRLGAFYTPLAVLVALCAWALCGDPVRFLAVLVVATPCPLLIAIPVAIIGSISLAAKRAIIVRNPVALERVDRCRTIIFDKTGTLTYGKPRLIGQSTAPEFDPNEALSLATSLEQYSRHPLAQAMIEAGRGARVVLREASQISERPGEGLTGVVGGRHVRILSRQRLIEEFPESAALLPPHRGGLECVVVVDGRYAATFQFRDTPRSDGALFVNHLRPRHGVDRVLLVSGDRESEVRYLAEEVGIHDVYFSSSPERKVEIVREEMSRAETIFVGDGINDAPALISATVGIAFGERSDVTTQAADVVILDSSLAKVDEFLHISQRMRRILLQSAVGGMVLSIVGMLVAAAGYLPPVAGAVVQEIIDVLAVTNALRVALRPKTLTDY
ncbi:MAG: heavy metal translocating P-type ATPase [Planctomycetota bacterium]